METELQIPSTNPYLPRFTTLGASLYVPEQCSGSKQIAVMAHGHAGHRDYCYQRLLSRTLSIPSIRFDFSGCGIQLGLGTLEGAEHDEVPRVMESDDYDLSTVIEYVRKEGYFVSALVGHSRGAVACLNYAKRDHSIWTVVNCSGRYRGRLIHEKISKNPLVKPDSIGYWEKHRAGTGGALVNKFTLLSEIASVGAQEMYGISEKLSQSTDVLVIFGTKDNVVPVEDAGMFMHDLKTRASLYLIDEADHNFFIQPSKPGTPKINKNQEVANLIADYSSPESISLRLLQRNNKTLPSVQGLENFRPIGGHHNLGIGHLYRSGSLSNLTSSGSETLGSIIHTIIDLRSDQEVELYGASQVDGVTTIRLPPFKSVDYSPAGLSKFFGPPKSSPRDKAEVQGDEYERGVQNIVKASKSILVHCMPLFPTIFDLILQSSEETSGKRRGILIHCTAGKDRTGVIAAVFLRLCGVHDEIIAMDYELSRFASVSIGHVCDAEIMRRTLRVMDAMFGGVDQYLLQEPTTTTPARLERVKDILKSSITPYHDDKSKL